jgi:hypothetical protein
VVQAAHQVIHRVLLLHPAHHPIQAAAVHIPEAAAQVLIREVAVQAVPEAEAIVDVDKKI